MATLADFRRAKPTWCPGCGDFGVLSALQKAALNLGLGPDDLLLVSGIGCSGKIADYFGSYGFHGLHGRALPIAQGARLANRRLKVVAAGGDGDGFGIGVGHFVHAMRRNVDLTYIVMDNHIYGLTTGQLSPTSDQGFKSKTSPDGSAEEPVHPLELALANHASFVAQGFSGDVKHLTQLFERALAHKGFALVNVISPCVTFNKVNTYDYYKERLVNLDEDPAYDRRDRAQAFRRVLEAQGLVLGVLYEEERPTFEELLPGYAEEPLARLPLEVSPELWGELIRDLA